MFGNWNRCIELARSDWITILNDDDLLENLFIDKVWNARQKNSMIAVKIDQFGKANNRSNRKNFYDFFRKQPKKIELHHILRKNPINGSLGALINKKTAIDIGGYNEEYYPIADYVFTCQYWLKEGMIIIPEKLAKYRLDCNESLKINTLNGFLIGTYFLRKNLISNIDIKKSQKNILLELSKYQAKVNALEYKYGINQEFNGIDKLSEIGLKPIKFTPLRIAIKIITIAWMMACFNINSSKLTQY